MTDSEREFAEFSIRGSNIQFWSKCVQTLVHCGDESIHFKISPDSVVLTSYNTSVSIFASFTFKESFFETLQSTEGLQGFCVPCKSFVKPFRSMKFLKSVLFCKFKVCASESNDIFVELQRKEGTFVRYNINLIQESEAVMLDFTPDMLRNYIKVEPKFLLTNLANFASMKGANDLTMKAAQHKMYFRNNLQDISRKELKVSSELTLNAIDFSEFVILEDSEVTFSLKDLKNFAHFADYAKLIIAIHFQNSDDPMMVVLNSEHVDANLTMATKVFSQEENQTQSSTCSTDGRISDIPSTYTTQTSTRSTQPPPSKTQTAHKQAQGDKRKKDSSSVPDDVSRKRFRSCFPDVGKNFDIYASYPGLDTVLLADSDDDDDE